MAPDFNPRISPSSSPLRFLKGLPVKAASPSEELLEEVVRDPIPGAIRYLLITKVGAWPGSFQEASNTRAPSLQICQVFVGRGKAGVKEALSTPLLTSFPA